MISKEFLENCSDEQVNMGVAWLEAKSTTDIKKHIERVKSLSICGYEWWDRKVIFYCKNPNDIMPIAFANRINLTSPSEHRDLWKASATKGGGNWSINDFMSANLSPLRAIAEVYILMSVEK
jgi:hypothetical protein